ncbi:MAG: AbrB/MazE/SpoVT family DNA-binding domain-containing protein [Halobacteriales archaeon]|nr:AbrB/MazE/SpoVT family DNA-binding domain-containing protein [Halobacteriales archaeon]
MGLGHGEPSLDVDAEDGRIYLPKRFREKYGDRFELVDRGDRLGLIPIDEDPLAGLREEVRGTDTSVAELKESALEEAGR